MFIYVLAKNQSTTFLHFGITQSMSDKSDQQKKQRSELQSLPTKQYLDQTVAPILLRAMQVLARERPPDPISYLAAYLLKNKSQCEENITDQS